MRPSVILLGFVLGSIAAITFGLAGVAVVFAVLEKDHPQLASEVPVLVANLAAFVALTAVGALSFYAQLHGRRWRYAAIAGLVLGIGAVAWVHRPA